MNTAVAKTTQKKTLLAKFAEKFSVEESKVMSILKSTAFKVKDGEATDEQMMALMVVADQYGLNPFTKEIYAYPDKGSIVPVVGVDGWNRIMNEHKEMDGIEFKYSEGLVTHNGKQAHEWIEAIIHRKDRTRPVVVREYWDEVYKKQNYASPWDSHPKRMHRHKAAIQCARIAFGFAGIYDEDEAERILEKDITSQAERVVEPLGDPEVVYFTDAEVAEKKEAWIAGIKRNKQTVDNFILFAQSKGKSFTEDQKADMNTWPIAADEKPVDDAFVDEMNAAEKESDGK